MNLLWISFLNSDARDHLGQGNHIDHLDDPRWLRKWLADHKLGKMDVRDPGQVATLRNLRSLLQNLVRSIADGKRPAKRDVDELNRRLAGESARIHVSLGDTKRLDIAPRADGASGIAFRIAMSFADFLVSADWNRLKLCENPDCRWVIYDETRSRTRRWCADNCGNLIKVRRFRKRQAKK